jgi:hypothetical protein
MYKYLRIESYPKLYAMIFIYLYLGAEVLNKVPKQSHDSHQPLTSMKQNIKHSVTNDPQHDLGGLREYGIRRGSDCSLWAPRLNPGPRRWLTRCLCRTHRSH